MRHQLFTFTWNQLRVDKLPVEIKGRKVQPKDHVEILGVVMDARLKYRQHMVRSGVERTGGSQRSEAATARQLFTVTVAPVVDYASGCMPVRVNNKDP